VEIEILFAEYPPICDMHYPLLGLQEDVHIQNSIASPTILLPRRQPGARSEVTRPLSSSTSSATFRIARPQSLDPFTLSAVIRRNWISTEHGSGGVPGLDRQTLRQPIADRPHRRVESGVVESPVVHALLARYSPAR
jgi:hypothetical protein